MKSKDKEKAIGITTPRGFQAAACTCGIKASGKPDMTLIAADEPCAVAGVFTTNKVPGAPVIVSKRHLERSRLARAVVINSGCANVCTGKQGLADALAMCRQTAKLLGCKTEQVLVCSTGIIGRPLPMGKVRAGIDMLGDRLDRGKASDAAAANGILTTDLVSKTSGRSLRLGGKRVTVAGIAKGSGMIAPNMATMLAFITTDAAVTPAQLRAALKAATIASFNRISVDHDTSTSDSLIALASGVAGNRTLSRRDLAAFIEALTDVCKDLAYMIVKDGEGATRVFRMRVEGARSEKDADLIGYTVVGSPLVKTAVHGGDPNWGRILAAAGRSGASLKPDRTDLYIGEHCVLKAGQPLSLRKGEQREVAKVMRQSEVTFTLRLNLGKASVEWIGCDLSKQYVTINADYST